MPTPHKKKTLKWLLIHITWDSLYNVHFLRRFVFDLLTEDQQLFNRPQRALVDHRLQEHNAITEPGKSRLLET